MLFMKSLIIISTILFTNITLASEICDQYKLLSEHAQSNFEKIKGNDISLNVPGWTEKTYESTLSVHGQGCEIKNDQAENPNFSCTWDYSAESNTKLLQDSEKLADQVGACVNAAPRVRQMSNGTKYWKIPDNRFDQGVSFTVTARESSYKGKLKRQMVLKVELQ